MLLYAEAGCSVCAFRGEARLCCADGMDADEACERGGRGSVLGVVLSLLWGMLSQLSTMPPVVCVCVCTSSVCEKQVVMGECERVEWQWECV